MKKNVNTVKTIDEAERGYHHGALGPALIAAAESVLAERGIEGFSLRETARRAGVSAAAPAHHFGDTKGLLTAIATLAFTGLGDALEAADWGDHVDRRARIRAQGMAYVRFALANRARFDLMWRAPLLDRGRPGYAFASRRAYVVLERAVLGEQGEDDFGPGQSGPIACWSMVHGFARLVIDGAFPIEDEAALAAALEQVLPAVLDHLDV